MKHLKAFAPCLLVLALPLGAQTVSYGVSAGGVMPTADLRAFNRNPGLSAGGFLDLDLGGGSVFRPRLDAVYLPEKGEDDAGTRFTRKFWGAGLSADYLYHFAGSRRGLFALVGIGLYHLEARARGPLAEDCVKANKIGGLIGLGYTFNAHWDANLRYTYTTFNSGLPSQRLLSDPTAGMAVLAAEYRF